MGLTCGIKNLAGFFKGRGIMEKYKKISRILWLVMFGNIFIATIKIIIALKFNSNSLLADGYHALTDSASNIIGIIGIGFASKPADEKHPYGYQKFETIASFFIGILLLFISFQIVREAVNWFFNPVVPNVDNMSLIFLGIGVIANIIIAKTEYKKGKQLKSEVLMADSIHTRSDIFISTGVILTLILIKLGLPPIIDPLLSLVIAFLVFLSCLAIFRETIHILVDKSAVDKNEISKIIYDCGYEIINVHKIRSRGKNDYVFIDLHLILHPEKTVKEAHDLNHKLENILITKLNKKVELNAHIEPNDR
jgi:cation diffusion facilitator family transporter